MAKTYIDTVKYLIYTNVEIDGLVEKPDVVGAIFGQTEGLLGDELDLRDLQKNGRIGRIEVDLGGREGKTKGVIKIPSSLDMVETCIIAAALETVDRVGPCEARLTITKIEDTRSVKRKFLVDRAKGLLRTLLNTEIPESKEISEMVRDEVKTAEIVEYGADHLPAGPGIEKVNDVVFVEGRADVINLLKNDVTNTIAIGGAKVTKTIVELSRRKEVTVFLDGDRGGDIILNELVQGGVDIDFVARAPTGMEVEELTRKELIKYLRNRMPFEQGNPKRGNQTERRKVEVPKFRQEFPNEPNVDEPVFVVSPPVQRERVEQRERSEPRIERGVGAERVERPERQERQERFERGERTERTERTERPSRSVSVVPSIEAEPSAEAIAEPSPIFEKVSKNDLLKELGSLDNTLRARFYNVEFERVSEVAVRDVIKSLGERNDVHAIVFDGIITQRLADLASKQGVRVLVGLKIGNVNKTPENIEIITKAK